MSLLITIAGLALAPFLILDPVGPRKMYTKIQSPPWLGLITLIHIQLFITQLK